jgi:XPG N-terminal domain
MLVAIVTTFDTWVNGAGTPAKKSPLEDLRGYTVGIEAAQYLDKLLNTPSTKEKLLSALGGVPLALRKRIEDDIAVMQEAGITPVFVFSGLDIVGAKERNLEEANASMQANNNAWELYDDHKPGPAVDTFALSGMRDSNFLENDSCVPTEARQRRCYHLFIMCAWRHHLQLAAASSYGSSGGRHT